MENTDPVRYAGALSRLIASIIDTIILGIVQFVIGVVIGIMLIIVSPGQSEDNPVRIIGQLVSSLISFIVSFGYPIYFIGTRGQTLGKMAMSIRVVGIESGKHPSFVDAFLRETVGKFVSGIVLGLGFLWIIWDAKKQGWHDKIARTVVIKL